MKKIIVAFLASLFLADVLLRWVPSMSKHIFTILGVGISWIFLPWLVFFMVMHNFANGKK